MLRSPGVRGADGRDVGRAPGHRLTRRPAGGRDPAAAWRALARDARDGRRALAQGARALLDGARRIAGAVGSGRREAVVMLLAYGLYNLVRGLWGGTLAEGTANAAALIDLERDLGIWVEPAWQRTFQEHALGMPAWSAFYVLSQVIVLPLTLFLVFRYRRGSYAFLRDMALLSWAAGLVCYALYPVAPPRLVDSGLADTVSAQTPIALDSDLIRLLYNPVAAMPSLHVGMAPVVAWALWRLTPWAWSKALGLAYPVLVSVAVVVTGNHYLLDIVGGVAIVLPAALVAHLLTRAPGGARGAVTPPGAAPPSDDPDRPGRVAAP
jgi:membrane-associated phospholipid phosphatase